MDLSLVYGSNQALSDMLREFRSGRMIVEVRRGREYPPTNPNRTDVCDGEGPNEPCYLAGQSHVFLFCILINYSFSFCNVTLIALRQATCE